MLKGFFYRRMLEINQFPTDVLIRFEINSKESISAKVAYLSQEGIQFFLPRGKVILVPDERILLILNSPEHGEFKIPSDVYYFCNLNNHNEPEQVCYGVKFFELSASTWEVILDFCGAHFPEITFLSPSGNGQGTAKPANQTIITPKPIKKTTDSASTALPRTEPSAPFMPLPPLSPLIPIEPAAVISNLVTALHQTPKTERPIEPQKAKSTMPLPTKIEASAPPTPFSPAAKHISETAAEPDPMVKTPTSATADTAAMAATHTPFQPDFNSLSIASPSPATASSTRAAAMTKPELKSIPNVAAIITEARQENQESHTAKSNPSSIQVLAASLATPPLTHSQPKAQSLSQEMIDRLIEKLQAENAGEPTDPLPPAPPNPLPDHLRVNASELNDAYQNKPKQGQPDPVGKPTPSLSDFSFTGPIIPGAPFKAGNFQSGDLKRPETKSNDPAQPTVTNTTGAVPFDPFAAFNFKAGVATPFDKPEGPGQAEAVAKIDTVGFDPFKPFNFKAGHSNQPEPKPNDSGASFANNPAPFDPFTPFNTRSNPTVTLTSKSNEPTQSEVKSQAYADLFGDSQKAQTSSTLSQGGTSLGDLVNNLDSTINKNVTPISANKSMQQSPSAAAKLTPKTAPNISLEDLKNMELPYSGKVASLDDVPLKTVSPAPVAMSNTAAAKTSGTTAAAPPKPEKAAAPPLKKPTIGPAIISNAPGVSLDQKAIDKLVDSLIQDMAADEPAPTEPPDLPNLTKQATPLGNGMTVKKETEPKISPTIPAANATPFANLNNKGLNIGNFDLGNARIMDQKSIDMIVKTLTEAESGATDIPGLEAGQPPLTNAIPLRPFTAQETKRTLDQKAIDQVVQALTQNFAAKNKATDANNGAAVPFSNNKTVSASGKPVDFQNKGRNAAFSATSLAAALLLETGEVLHAVVEQIYVGGLMVTIDRELPLNSTLKLNISGNGIHITDVLGTCTNCELAPSGKNGFVAEIFFKNMNNTHMEQFRTLIAKLDPRHQI